MRWSAEAVPREEVERRKREKESRISIRRTGKFSQSARSGLFVAGQVLKHMMPNQALIIVIFVAAYVF